MSQLLKNDMLKTADKVLLNAIEVSFTPLSNEYARLRKSGLDTVERISKFKQSCSSAQ